VSGSLHAEYDLKNTYSRFSTAPSEKSDGTIDAIVTFPKTAKLFSNKLDSPDNGTLAYPDVHATFIDHALAGSVAIKAVGGLSTERAKKIDEEPHNLTLFPKVNSHRFNIAGDCHLPIKASSADETLWPITPLLEGICAKKYFKFDPTCPLKSHPD
jgi:hypothetical protein